MVGTKSQGNIDIIRALNGYRNHNLSWNDNESLETKIISPTLALDYIASKRGAST
jgi:hypothetical protein